MIVSSIHRLVALAFVSLVISGLLVFTFAEEKSDQPVEILRNEYPKTLPQGETTFSFSLVAREDLARLEIRFASVTTKDLSPDELIDPDIQENITDPEDLLDNVMRNVWFVEKTAELGIEPVEDRMEIDIQGSDFDLLVRDYTDMITCHLGPSLLGQNVTRNVPLIFGVFMNETNHQYLEGKLDFFPVPTLNIKALTISHNENETRYIPDDDVWEGSDRLPISSAPRGLAVFESVDRDDTVTVVITVEPGSFSRATDSPIAMLHLISIYIDGERYSEPIANILR